MKTILALILCLTLLSLAAATNMTVFPNAISNVFVGNVYFDGVDDVLYTNNLGEISGGAFPVEYFIVFTNALTASNRKAVYDYPAKEYDLYPPIPWWVAICICILVARLTFWIIEGVKAAYRKSR